MSAQYLPAVTPLTDKSPLVAEARRLISLAWNMPNEIAHIPSPNPVSIERSHLDFLQKNINSFVVAEKSDGVRYLLLLGRHGAAQEPYSVMINRKFEIFEVSVYANPAYFDGSVFDGELVLEDIINTPSPKAAENEEEDDSKIDESQKKQRQVFLAFDVMLCKGRLFKNENYFERYKELNRVFELHQKDILVNNVDKWDDVAKRLSQQEDKIVSLGNRLALAFAPKPCVQATNVGSLWRSMSRMRHKSDGLIFTPVYQPVMTGTHQTMFKWKQTHTLDMLVDATYSNRAWSFALAYKDGKEYRWTGQAPYPTINRRPVHLKVRTNPRLDATAEYFGNKNKSQFRLLGEFSCTMDNGNDDDRKQSDGGKASQQQPLICWCELVRWREDKATPNNINVINNTLVNIYENIQIDELLRIASYQMYGI